MLECLMVNTIDCRIILFFSFFSLLFLQKRFFWITQLCQKKWWAKMITKFEYCHRSYRVWTSKTCSHSGQTDVLQRSATLPVATYPVSCFPQSVVMRVIPLCKAVWARSCDHVLSIFWKLIEGDAACLGERKCQQKYMYCNKRNVSSVEKSVWLQWLRLKVKAQ